MVYIQLEALINASVWQDGPEEKKGVVRKDACGIDEKCVRPTRRIKSIVDDRDQQGRTVCKHENQC